MLKYVKLNERWILICEVCIQVGLHVQEIIRNVSKAHLEERLNEGREEDEQSTIQTRPMGHIVHLKVYNHNLTKVAIEN